MENGLHHVINSYPYINLQEINMCVIIVTYNFIELPDKTFLIILVENNIYACNISADVVLHLINLMRKLLILKQS